MSMNIKLASFGDPRNYELGFDNRCPNIQSVSDLLRQDYLQSLQAGLVLSRTIETDQDRADVFSAESSPHLGRHLGYATVDKLGSLAFIGNGTENTIQLLLGARQASYAFDA